MGSTVADLLYWRNTQTSAIVCTSLVVSLLCLSQFSIISVGSYVALLLLCATITLRVYRKALQAVNKSDGVNPFQIYLDEDVALSKEQVDKYVDRSLAQVTTAMKTLRHLFLVEDLVDSLKLLVLLYLFTYIGAVFNGLTLLILGTTIRGVPRRQLGGGQQNLCPRRVPRRGIHAAGRRGLQDPEDKKLPPGEGTAHMEVRSRPAREVLLD